MSGEERAGGTLLERYEPLCANVPRREKSDTRMHPAIARAMKWGTIQNLHAPLVHRALSSIVSLRSTIPWRSLGRKLRSHAYLRLRSTFHPADSQHYRGDHDQDPRSHFSDRFCDHLTPKHKPALRRPSAAPPRPRSHTASYQPGHQPRWRARLSTAARWLCRYPSAAKNGIEGLRSSAWLALSHDAACQGRVN